MRWNNDCVNVDENCCDSEQVLMILELRVIVDSMIYDFYDLNSDEKL